MTPKSVLSAQPAEPRSPEPKWQRRKEDRPAEITAAALKIFAERGFAAARLEDVAELAGVSKATIYLYFDSKADLFKAVLEAQALPRIGQIEAMIGNFDGPSADLIRGLLHFARDNLVATPELRKIVKTVMAEAGNFPELAQHHLDTVVLRMLGNIQRIIERGIERGEFRPCDTLMTAQCIFAPMLLNALAQETFGDIPQFNPDRLLEAHIEFALGGLAANTNTSKGSAK